MRAMIPAFLLLATAACLPGATIVGGEIADVEFQPSSAIHFEENDIVFMVFAEYPGFCERLREDDANVEDLKTLSIVVGDIDEDQSTDDVEPGEYEINGQLGKVAFAGFAETDGNCQVDTNAGATDGVVVIDSYDRDTSAVGSFDLEIDGDDIEGNFRTAECDIDLAEFERDADECDP